MNTKRPAPNAAFDLIASHLAEVTVELFAAYERGVLIMVATETAVTAWMRAAGAAEGELADTLGEFSNMLLGRLKGRLLVEGVQVMLATPTTTSGSGPPKQATAFCSEY